jgi:hypothetical protein
MLDLVLSLLLRAVTAQQAKRAAERGLLRLAASLLMALFLLAAIACLLAALWIYLGMRLGPAAAPAIVAAVLLVLAGAVALTLRFRQSGARLGDMDSFPEFSSLSTVLRGGLRGHAAAILLGAAVLGLLSGGKNRRRG